MFDFRYHALSLAAVLIALAVGLLLGVAIGDANLVSTAEKHLRNSLTANLNQARTDASELRAQLAFRNDFERAVYRQFVAGALKGKRIGLIFLGHPSNQLTGLVRDALDPSGGQLVLVAVIRDPVNAPALGSAAAPTRYAALVADPAVMNAFGVRMGLQLITGGHLITQVAPALFSSYNGVIERLDGIVIVRAPGAIDPAAQHANDEFESGLASGLAATGAPVVGVETSSANPSMIPWYTRESFSSVDDLEDVAGATALVEALTGAHGVFGSKSTATTVLPPGIGRHRP